MLNVSIFGNKAEIYALVHIVPQTCQHITDDQSHSSGDMVPKIMEISGEWGHKDYHKNVRVSVNRNMPQRWIGRRGKEVDALVRWPLRSPDLTSCVLVSEGLWRTLSFFLHSPLISRIFATLSTLLWLWSAVKWWHVCGTSRIFT
jgi:hypothetical protein